MSRPTLKDVAAKAGMSVTQVSRALNDHDDVAESTKELARSVAAELRYTPNREARRLKDPRVATGTIGMILPSESLRFSDPFFGDLLSAITVEAGAHGLQLSLSTAPPDAPPTARYETAIRNREVDGFVVVRTLLGDPRVDALLAASFPFVTFGRSVGQNGFAAVEATEDCFDPILEHLVGLGHQRIACLAEPSKFALATARRQSFEAAAQRCAVPVDPALVVEAGFHERSGYDGTMTLLGRDDRPTAIVAMNDLLALGALEAAADSGFRVPADLSVVGFDDIRAARLVQPALTTLRFPAADIGTLLVRELVPAIEAGHATHSERRVQPTLVIRDSSGPIGTP